MLPLKSNFAGTLIITLVITSGLILKGCGGDPDQQPPEQEGLQQEEIPPAEGEAEDPMDDQMQAVDLAETLILENLSSMVSAVEGAGMMEELQQGGPYTVFSPTDEAFHQAPEEVQQLLIDPEPEALEEVVGYHIAEGEYNMEDLMDMDEIQTIAGQTLEIESDGEDLFIGGTPVAFSNIEAENGVIHTIEEVLVDPGYAEILR